MMQGTDAGSGSVHPSTSSLLGLGFIGLVAAAGLVAVGLSSTRPTTSVFAVVGVLLVAAAAVLALVMTTQRDAVSVLSLVIVIAVALPARYTISGLGPAGVPSILLGLVALGLWVYPKLLRDATSHAGFQLLHLALALVGCAALISSATAFAHSLTDVEVGQVERELINYGAYLGIALLAADGIATAARLDTLLRRLVLVGVFLSVLGISQFVLGVDPYARLQLPGFRISVDLLQPGFAIRGQFQRAFGSTEQPIEFAAVLTAVLPLAIHYAMHAPARRRLEWWLAVGVIAVAIPLSVSRTALIGLAAGMTVLAASWTWRQRFSALGLAVFGVLAARAVVPSLVGTFFSLVANAGQDISITGRTSRYDLIGRYFLDSPLVGWGLGRSRPGLPIVDNQYLATLVDGGVIALVALVALLMVAMATSWGPGRLAGNASSRSLSVALAASIVVAMVSFATYDALEFRIASIVLFLVIGAGAARRRLFRLQERAEVQSRTPAVIEADLSLM